MSSPPTTKPTPTSTSTHYHHDVADLAADLMCSAKKQSATTAASSGSTTTTTAAAAETDVHRAMDSTSTWKPILDRRQSWSKEDQKHELQMSPLDEGVGRPGFTEERR